MIGSLGHKSQAKLAWCVALKTMLHGFGKLHCMLNATWMANTGSDAGEAWGFHRRPKMWTVGSGMLWWCSLFNFWKACLGTFRWLVGAGLKNELMEHRLDNKRLWTSFALDHFGRRLSPTSCGESPFSILAVFRVLKLSFKCDVADVETVQSC